MEAGSYGAAGSRPQVVWSNGVLASTAVGIITQLLTPWFDGPPEFVYLDYDGNRGTVTPNDRVALFRDKICPHHPPNEVGDPLFDVRSFNPLAGKPDEANTKKSPKRNKTRGIVASTARFFRGKR
jgi:molybdopterin-synthase adenylyltransferase